MTHDRVSNFATELAQMALASQRLPEVEGELRAAHRAHEVDLDTIQMLELRIMDLKSQADYLRATVRKVEAERDDAELRFLECDDAKTTLVRTLEVLGKDVAGVLAAVMPIPTAPTVTEGVSVLEYPTPTASDGPTEASSSGQGTDGSTTVESPSPFSGTTEPLPSPSASSSDGDTNDAGLRGDPTTDNVSLGDGVSVLLPPTLATAEPVSPTADDGAATASAPSTATPSADATSGDLEPQHYIETINSEGYPTWEVNPSWTDWVNRHGKAS
jgi:hypothetical protein